jgi:hypothetical protein
MEGASPAILQWRVALGLLVVVIAVVSLGSALHSAVMQPQTFYHHGINQFGTPITSYYCVETHENGRSYHSTSRGDFPIQPGPCPSITDRNVPIGSFRGKGRIVTVGSGG